jgi:hypothetical protein
MVPLKLNLYKSQRLLCQVVSDDAAKSRDAALDLVVCLGEHAAFELACANQTDVHLAHALRTSAFTSPSKKIHEKTHEETYGRLSTYMVELDNIASLLATQSIPLVALKNSGIARAIYPCPGCCPMGDVDVLVRKRDFRAAHQILLNEGYNFEFRSALEERTLTHAESSGGAEYWKILPSGDKLWFELQWRPIAGRWIRPDQEPSADKLIDRSIPIPGTDVRLLSPEDNLLQVSLHTAKHTYVRAPGFRLHTDVDRIVRRLDIDWDIFLARVKSLRVKTAVYFSLAIPYSIFDTPIPVFVLKELEPSLLKNFIITRWIRRAGLFNPDEKKFSKVGYIAFNSLLYDDFKGLAKGILPDGGWLKERYGFDSNLLVPFYHLKRLCDLALRRAST